MNGLAWAFAGIAAAFALVDWWATATERRPVRLVSKPAALAALIVVSIVLDAADPTIRAWMVAGLVLSLAGDVFLLGDERWFVGGLASFLLGHVAYVVGLQLAPTSLTWTLVGLASVVVAGALIGRTIVGGVGRTDRRMVGPVVVYMVVISAMVVSAFGTRSGWAIAGAVLFFASDGILAQNRFVRPFAHGNLAVMVTYHLGQAGLVAWLV